VPSEKLSVVAITGTNGKTSTTWWVAQALGTLGRRCGVVGTLGIGEPPHGRASNTAAPTGTAEATGELGSVESTGLTTPDPIRLQNALRDFVDRGFAACAIEASSIGIAEHRLAGTRVAIAVFTNFTQDHLDYHGDMAAYWQAKAQLFAWPGLKAAVVNVDDEQGSASPSRSPRRPSTPGPSRVAPARVSSPPTCATTRRASPSMSWRAMRASPSRRR
jgi:UDP-N-acetylmuramoyl-L-alanyl-D-glutamate--2,6-diaminopimelate ligase